MISEKRDENWSTGLQDDLKRMQKKKVNQKKGKSWWCEVIGKFHMQIQHCIRTILFAATSLQYPPLSGPHQQLNFPTFISIMVEYNTNRALQDVAEWEKEQNLNWMKILGSLVEKWWTAEDCDRWIVARGWLRNWSSPIIRPFHFSYLRSWSTDRRNVTDSLH